uniref:Protease 2 n=1 Tax=Arundo donax TaxID=35708 RepID=A0A0A9DYM8_ARUDO
MDNILRSDKAWLHKLGSNQSTLVSIMRKMTHFLLVSMPWKASKFIC